MAAFEQVARAIVDRFDAEVVKSIGDALLIRAPQADAAVAVAARLVSEVGYMDRALGVCVGMHTGTAVERDGDWFGSAVNVAARVAGIAGAGEVVLTAATRDSLARLPALRLLGHHALRNITSPVELWALKRDGHPVVERVVDPVCRMSLDPQSSALRVMAAAGPVFFCSERCMSAFLAAPGTYEPGGGGAADARFDQLAPPSDEV